MSDEKVLALGKGQYAISGELNMRTVPKLWQQLDALIQDETHDHLSIDLQGVLLSHSVGLSLLIECMRLAKRKKQLIEFKNLPEQMQSIAKMSGLESVLPK